MTQEVLAADARLPPAHISRIERAKANPTLLVMTRIAKALRVDITALLELRPGTYAAVASLKRGRKPKRTPRFKGPQKSPSS
jgi:transcriptional regulator with XRE-family HTH domain